MYVLIAERKMAKKTERDELEKAGRLADDFKSAFDQEEARPLDAEPTVEEQAQARKAVLERTFKEKA